MNLENIETILEIPFLANFEKFSNFSKFSFSIVCGVSPGFGWRTDGSRVVRPVTLGTGILTARRRTQEVGL